MVSVLILGFLAGGIFANGLVHFVKGSLGKSLPIPLLGNSSAMVNVTWGWIDGVIAVLLWHVAPMANHPRAAFIAAAVGVLLVGWCLAAYMGKHAKAK